MAIEKKVHSKALAKVDFSPETFNFTSPKEGQFFYFENSEMGGSTTFGMSEKILANKIKKTLTEIIQKFQNENETDSETSALYTLQNTFINSIDQCQQNDNLSLADMCEKLHKTGHIPVMLSAINSVLTYNKATRDVSIDEMQAYFEETLGAKKQAINYLKKCDLMGRLAKLREKLVTKRYSLTPSQPAFVLCNKLVNSIDKLILENQKSMPKFESFDLYPTFVTKLCKLYSQLPLNFVRLREKIKSALMDHASAGYGKTNPALRQEKLSKNMYTILKNEATKMGAFKKTISTKTYNLITPTILPFLVYLNSPQNPFAQDGLKADTALKDSLYEKALSAYKSHESETKYYGMFTCNEETNVKEFARNLLKDKNCKTPDLSMKYSEEQIIQLLYGKTKTNSKSSRRDGLQLLENEKYLQLECNTDNTPYSTFRI